MKPVKIFILLLWFSLHAVAQKEIRYTVENGLPSNHVYKIAQDNEGFIWILTDKGMVRFDGTEFKTFTTRDGLPLNDIWDIRFTPDGRAWYFTRASRLGFIQGNQVYSFPNIDSSVSLHPASIFQNGNDISFGHRLSEYPTGTNSPVWIVDTVAVIKQHQITKTQLLKLDQESATYHSGQANDSLFLTFGESKYIVLNTKTGQEISHRYDEFDPSLTKVEFPRFNIQNGVIQIYGLGFSAILDTSGKLINLTKELEQYHAHCGFEDTNGNLWMATVSDGVYFIPAAKRQANYPILGKKVNQLDVVNEKIIASIFNTGFYTYNQTKGTFYPFIPSQGAIYKGIPINQSTEYYLTDKKYIKITGNQREDFLRDFKQTSIFDLITFHDTLYGLGSMLLATVNEDNLTWQRVTTSIGLSDFIVYQNRLIIASSNGLMEYQNGQINQIKIGANIFDKPSLHLDTCQGKLVVSTDGFGAYLTDLQSVDSLPQSAYLSVQSSCSQSNNLWLATNTGVLHYKIMDDQPELQHQYTLNDGLLANSVSDVLVLGDSLMTSSAYGISILPLNTQSTQNNVLDIRFKNIFYNDKAINNDTKYYFLKNNQLKVSIAFIDYSMEKNKNFEYRLLPIIKDWQSSAVTDLSFSNLPPKSYQLEIKKGDLTRKIKFTIKPIWYQTAFAKILFALLILGGIVWGAKSYNSYHLHKQKRLLSVRRKEIEQELYALRSQMNPHFVFNSLNAIQYYIANNDNDISEKYLVKFSKLIRMFFNFSRRKTITLKEEINLIDSYLTMEKLRFGENLTYEITTDPDLNLSNQTIPTMLLQPILENAVNHGIFHKKGIGRIRISFKLLEKNGYIISISDNGIGWKNVQEVLQKSMSEHDLNSTKILLERIDLLNKTKNWSIAFKVYEAIEFDSGTTIIFTIYPNEKTHKPQKELSKIFEP